MNDSVSFLSDYPTDWSLWEIYRVGPAIKDWGASIKKLIKIQSLKDFYEIALYIPHLQPSKLFYDKENKSKTKYRLKVDNKEDFYHIDSICLFRGDVPPLTEHHKNFNGGAHYYMFSEMKPSQIDQIWLSLTTSLVTNDGISSSDIINGVRFCDKSKPKENSVQYRLEVWTESNYFHQDHFAFHNNSVHDIEKILKESGLEIKHSYKAHHSQE